MMNHSEKALEAVYWSKDASWYNFNPDTGYTLTDAAPERARKSFQLWKKTAGFVWCD